MGTNIKDGDLHQLFQLAYRAGQSIETALNRVHNDILRDIDAGQCVILILLDLSSTFRIPSTTVFYLIGLDIALVSRARLLRGSALIYLTEASSCILRTNAPQAFGPLLYSIYVASFTEIIAKTQRVLSLLRRRYPDLSVFSIVHLPKPNQTSPGLGLKCASRILNVG